MTDCRDGNGAPDTIIFTQEDRESIRWRKWDLTFEHILNKTREEGTFQTKERAITTMSVTGYGEVTEALMRYLRVQGLLFTIQGFKFLLFQEGRFTGDWYWIGIDEVLLLLYWYFGEVLEELIRYWYLRVTVKL